MCTLSYRRRILTFSLKESLFSKAAKQGFCTIRVSGLQHRGFTSHGIHSIEDNEAPFSCQFCSFVFVYSYPFFSFIDPRSYLIHPVPTLHRPTSLFIIITGITTRSSAVAVIADRICTGYDVWYTGKLSMYQTGFGYKFTNGWYTRSDSMGRFYERTQTLSTQAWPLSTTDQSSVVHEVSE